MPSRPIRPGVRRRERGVALAISLVLLVAMTVVGIATLAGTRLNERVTRNAQQKSIAFEVAESAIDTVWSAETVAATAASIPADEFDDPAPIELSESGVTLDEDFDQTLGDDTSVDVDGAVSIRYCGESPLPRGSSLSADESETRMVGALFDVNGVATIEGSATRSDHVQRGSLVRPATGRSASCTTPGV